MKRREESPTLRFSDYATRANEATVFPTICTLVPFFSISPLSLFVFRITLPFFLLVPSFPPVPQLLTLPLLSPNEGLWVKRLLALGLSCSLALVEGQEKASL